MKIISLLIFTFLFSSQAHAEVDKFNTYQWDKTQTKPWFEWWYYKIVLPKTKDSFFFVYGIVNPWDHAETQIGTRSYVGMGDFSAKKQVEKLFSPQQFHASYDQTLVEVEGLTATDKNIKGQLIDKDGDNYSWDISIQKDWAFNAMGWAIDKEVTNIAWYPAQASAHCSGSIISKGQLYQFSDALCYQDRNWGSSFPLWWTWIVSNNFINNPGTTLAVGGGRPKYLNTKFPLEGVSIGLKHKGEVYHFRPNDLDIVKVDINFGKWEIEAQNKFQKIEISAFAPKDKFMDLQFMTPEGEIFHDFETLTGSVTVKIFKRNFLKWTLIETLYSDEAGIEYGEPTNKKSLKTFFDSKKNLQ